MPNEINEITDPLYALSSISETINTLYDIDELLPKILHVALKTVNAQRGFILMSEPDKPAELNVRVAHNIDSESRSFGTAMASFSRSVVDAAIAAGETIISYNPLDDSRFHPSTSIVDQKIVAAACLPLRIKARRLGAIYIDSTETRGKFRPEIEPFLNAFAHQAAIAIENAQMYDRLREENRRLRKAIAGASEFSGIIGKSKPVLQVLDTVRSVMDTSATVLVLGESGTGKELVARALHYNSQLSEKPFIAFFCGALPESLLESELFGHVQGAFTGAIHHKKGLFEEAEGGTIFLDEIGDLSPKIQALLLRVLQEREIRRIGENLVRKINVRVVAATNKNLAEEVEAGRFRKDLYYRLNVITVNMPPLRDRSQDIILLAHHFLDRFAQKAGRKIAGFAQESLDSMLEYNWPGNVREMENIIERAVLLTKSEYLTPKDLRLPYDESTENTSMKLRDFERRFVEKILQQHNGNVTETAKALGVSRRWLHYRMKEWQIEV